MRVPQMNPLKRALASVTEVASNFVPLQLQTYWDEELASVIKYGLLTFKAVAILAEVTLAPSGQQCPPRRMSGDLDVLGKCLLSRQTDDEDEMNKCESHCYFWSPAPSIAGKGWQLVRTQHQKEHVAGLTFLIGRAGVDLALPKSQ